MPPDSRPMLVLVSVSAPKGFGVPNRAVSEVVVWIAVGTHAVCASSPGGCSCCIGLSNMCVGVYWVLRMPAQRCCQARTQSRRMLRLRFEVRLEVQTKRVAWVRGCAGMCRNRLRNFRPRRAVLVPRRPVQASNKLGTVCGRCASTD